MRDARAFLSAPPEALAAALAGALLCIVGTLAWRRWQRSRVTEEEKERRRRAALAARGKITAASLVAMREGHVFYSYDVRGVEYTASQNVAPLRDLLPADISLDIGHVLVKFDPRNPADSVILAEDWSGFRAGPAFGNQTR